MLSNISSAIETTEQVAQSKTFDFWRSTALAIFDNVIRVDPHQSFTAKRLSAFSIHANFLLTRSSPVGVEADARNIRQSGRDDVVISVLIDGNGYLEQSGRGGLLNIGDISFITLDRPFAAGAMNPYCQIRCSVPRSVFEAQVGDPAAFAGTRISASPLSALFTTYLQALSQTVTRMSEAEVGVAIEGILHLLRPLVHGPGQHRNGQVSQEALRSLADAHIQRRLHDPRFKPGDICATLNVSRSRLYQTFVDTDGVAAVIRDARLDRAYSRLLSSTGDNASIAAIMLACGFTDPRRFSKAFKNRFGISARDVRSLRRT